MSKGPQLPAVVLAGGGMRGAYQAGVLSGLVDVMQLRSSDPAPFRIFAGTSVGAINATFVACNAHRGDMDIARLEALWKSLELSETLKFRTSRLVRFLRSRSKVEDPAYRSLLMPRFLEELLTTHFDWARLHENVERGVVKALLVPALEIVTGRTTIFAELAPGVDFRPSPNPRRRAQLEKIGLDHVLGSAALPLLFPARRIGDRYYCDGGLRFNTPIAPAIRSGASRLLVISTRHEAEKENVVPDALATDYPSLPFLLGKVLNALLLDPVSYDLQVLQRLNGLLEILERTLPEETMNEISRHMIETRGTAYRRIETMDFSPSRDIGSIASQHAMRHVREGTGLGRLARVFLRQASTGLDEGTGDLASHLLFDGRYAEELIHLGREDALRRGDELKSFFGRR